MDAGIVTSRSGPSKGSRQERFGERSDCNRRWDGRNCRVRRFEVRRPGLRSGKRGCLPNVPRIFVDNLGHSLKNTTAQVNDPPTVPPGKTPADLPLPPRMADFVRPTVPTTSMQCSVHLRGGSQADGRRNFGSFFCVPRPRFTQMLTMCWMERHRLELFEYVVRLRLG